MLPKINRIKKQKDFEIIFKKGVSFKNSLFVLKFIKNSLNKTRVSFIVSNKISKKATVRNKIRRRLSEIVKKEINNIKGSLDIVFISLPGIEKKDFLELKDALNNLLIKAKIIKEDFLKKE